MDLEELIKLQELERNKNKSKKRTHPQTIDLELTKLWNSNSEVEWNKALEKYWKFVKSENVALEEKMDNLDPVEISNLTSEEFYYFLHDEYFVWKFTRKNYLKANLKHLQKYLIENRMDDLDKIKKNLFAFDLDNIKQGLEIASSIKGLGIAGASGLLALLFPKSFGTVDQFVSLNLLSIDNFSQNDLLLSMNPENIKLKDGVELIKILKGKADELNKVNNTDKWTPRKIDKALWGYRN
jgi:hypothetical protein